MSSHNPSMACTKCRYFEDRQASGSTSGETAGLCRFNPPVSQPDANSHGLWPVVSERDWCGHFSPESAA